MEQVTRRVLGLVCCVALLSSVAAMPAAAQSNGGYEFLQLDTDGVDAILEGGESTDVMIPGEAPLTFEEPFEIREDTRTTFTADFTPVERGQAGGYVLQPVAQGTSVDYEG